MSGEQLKIRADQRGHVCVIALSGMLDGPAARALVERARHTARYPAGHQSDQQNLFASMA